MKYRNAMFAAGAVVLGYALYRMLTLGDNEHAVRKRMARGHAYDADVFNGPYGLPQNHESDERDARKWLH